MDLDDHPVGADRRRRERQRQHQLAPAGGVARIDDHRQRVSAFSIGMAIRSSVNAVLGLERPDPALAQDHVAVALGEHVLGGGHELVDCRAETALEQHRAAGAADLGEQRVVLHVARTDLDHVGDLQHELQVADVEQLGDDRKPGLALDLGQQPQAGRPEATERIRGRPRLVCAARGTSPPPRRARARRIRAPARVTRPCTGRRSA